MPVAYVCRRCKGPALPQEPEGRCPNCGGFYRHNRVYIADGDVDGAESQGIEDGEPISAGDLYKNIGEVTRVPVPGMPGLNHVFNGGLPPFGGAVLVCSPAGTGKSTLLMVTLRQLAEADVKSIYVSAEQTLTDLGQQFSWLGPPSRKCSRHMLLNHLRERDDVVECLEKSGARVAVVDSLHAVTGVTDDQGFALSTGHANAVAQVGTDLKRLAGERQMVVFAVGHVLNDGTIAGGTRVRHMLDATLVLRPGAGERDPRRVLEFEGKNRFGPRGRQALFEMREDAFVDAGPIDPEAGPAAEPDPEERPRRKAGGLPN